MRILMLTGLTVLSVILYSTFYTQEIKKIHDKAPITQIPLPTKQKEQKKRDAIFIPYWNIPSPDKDLDNYDRIIYFGVAPGSDGNLLEDAGYQNMVRFATLAQKEKDLLLTVRMLDQSVNDRVLSDEVKQRRLVSETIDFAKKYQLSGIVLDLEVSGLSLLEEADKTSMFIRLFATETKRENMTLTVLVYGDVYYRARPYDMKVIGEVADEVMIMLYDFHKPRGEPGPNFPFADQGRYGYDVDRLAKDLKQDISLAKITIVYGMYGYDWTLGSQGKPLKAARAIPLFEIEEGIVPHCKQLMGKLHSDRLHSISRLMPRFSLQWEPSPVHAGGIPSRSKSASALTSPFLGFHSLIGRVKAQESATSYEHCALAVDAISKEKKITYTDGEGYRHELWYEDKESVEVKQDFFQKYGISSSAYWVWGYFR